MRGVFLAENELSYDMLWQTYQKEKRSNELQLIPKTFYEEAAALIGALRSNIDEGATQKENAARLLEGIFEKRKQKIMMYAAYGRKLPEPMPQQEAALYDGAVKMMKESTLDKTRNGPATNQLRAIQAIPEIILPSGKKLGPLEKDQTLEVKDREDCMFLMNNNICKEV